MYPTLKYPFYVKLGLVLLSLSLIVGFIYVGQQVLVPIMLALLFAILLRPVVNFLNTKIRLPHVIAVIISVVLFLLFIAGIVFFVSWQVGDMASDWDKIKNNILTHYHTIQRWISQHLNISYNEQQKYIEQASKDSFSKSGNIMGSTLSSFTGALLSMILVPIYTFLFLLYRNLFITFLTKLVSEENQGKLQDILMHVKVAIQSYVVGLLIEFGIVSTLTSIGLMIVGVEYAILLGVITGLLNLIPYIGILIAGLISILASLTSSTDLSLIIGVIVVNSVVQLLDNNIIIPMIVSSKVRINAFVSIAGVIIGGAIGGVAGMFLSIPIIAILKVVFDRIEELEPWGFLMGDDLPKTYEWGKIKLPSWDAGSAKKSNIKYTPVNTGLVVRKREPIKLNLKQIVVSKPL
ncbi:MAG: AI-2E family transporter [Bacteroidia bacterium]